MPEKEKAIWRKFGTRERYLYEKAVTKWGKHAQVDMVVEELAELIVALKHWKRGRISDLKVEEEAADVLIVLGQLITVGFIDEERVRQFHGEKLDRLVKRLNRG